MIYLVVFIDSDQVPNSTENWELALRLAEASRDEAGTFLSNIERTLPKRWIY